MRIKWIYSNFIHIFVVAQATLSLGHWQYSIAIVFSIPVALQMQISLAAWSSVIYTVCAHSSSPTIFSVIWVFIHLNIVNESIRKLTKLCFFPELTMVPIHRFLIYYIEKGTAGMRLQSLDKCNCGCSLVAIGDVYVITVFVRHGFHCMIILELVVCVSLSDVVGFLI